MKALQQNMLQEARYWNWKYNPLTAAIARRLLDWRSRQLKLVIFVATTGRSGTGSLTKIFTQIEGCVALHEPYPIMNGLPMINRNLGDSSLAGFMYKCIKSINIRRASMDARYYLETNHCMIKSFIDYLYEDFSPRLKIIHLYRDPVKVAESIYSLRNYGKCFPGTQTGNEWYLDYRAKNNLINLSDILDNNPEFLHDFYKCLWYWYEIEARVIYWKNVLGEDVFFDFNIDHISDMKMIYQLLDTLGIEYDKRKISEMKNTKENQKTSYKEVTLNVEEMHEMAKKFREILLAHQYQLPPASFEFN